MAGNQTGKSTSGAYELACHLTGYYPDWWEGKRFTKPITGWALGQSGSQIRETIQFKLVGLRVDRSIEPTGCTGGLIAKHLVTGYSLGHGTGDLFDSIRIRHVSGGESILSLKSYEQDATKLQGQTVNCIWADEEPPAEHYAEAMARLTGDGIIFVTFTPLLGYSEVVSRFLRETDPKLLTTRLVVKMGLDDIAHFTAEEKARRLASYPQHQREARSRGDPTLGSGAIFQTPERDLIVPADLQIPLHWSKLWGLDFGVTHPFAAVLICWDKDADVIYVVDTIRLSDSKPIEHASAIRRIAADVLCAWPHDGSKRESSLDTITSHYKREGLHMLGTHATFPDGSISTEAGILEMQERMATGRFRVKAHLADWLDEYRSYHRDKDGRIVKVRDDLLSATRIAIMAKRYAKPGPIGAAFSPYTARSPLPRKATGLSFDPFAVNMPKNRRFSF